MNEDDKKRLAEFLKLEWKTMDNSWGDDFPCSNRSFTSPQDMMDLKDKLVEKGMWASFWMTARSTWQDNTEKHWDNDMEWDNWLLNAPRFCQLVADFLREEGYQHTKVFNTILVTGGAIKGETP